MGTKFHLIFYANDDSLAQLASQATFNKIEKLDMVLSDYQPKSELNLLSKQSGTGKWIKVSPPLFEVVSTGLSVSHQSEGAFDITVGPYVQLWRQKSRSYKPSLPDPDTLQKLSKSVGYKHIYLNKTQHSVKLTRPNMQLDPGGIAKGYAADKALEVLQSYGISSALVNAGGDITVGNAPPGKEGWDISITTHRSKKRKENHTFTISNKAIATSGDLFDHVYIDNKRYSHIINPDTGIGLTDQSKVTVLAADGITADSFSSAISVLGPDAGIKLANKLPGIEAFIESQTDGKIISVVSDGFSPFKKKASSY